MLNRLFLAHPRKVDESYLEHAVFATTFASRLFVAGGAALVHAVIPALCEHTASGIVRDLELRTRGRSGVPATPAE